MTERRDETFSTPDAPSLYVEIGRGTVRIDAVGTTQTQVTVKGADAELVRVEHDGDQVSVIAPRQRIGFLGREPEYLVSVSLPLDSELAVRTGSADVTVSGRVGAARLRSGSGDVRIEALSGPAVVETGSGEVEIDEAGDHLRVKSGSGDVAVRRTAGTVVVSTGSGDVTLGSSSAPAAIKTGSGDLRVHDAEDDVSMRTGSGDLVVETFRRGRFTANGASGDVHVGVPAGIPVWTDLTSVSGEIRSDLVGAGRPAEGAEHIELRAKTVSGDITLHQR